MILVKVFVYIMVQFAVQSSILFDKCREGIVDSSQVMAWLNFEIMAFYLNIIAMGVFMLFSQTCRKYKSIRERVGLASETRKEMDFLSYCSEDLHWFQLWFS